MSNRVKAMFLNLNEMELRRKIKAYMLDQLSKYAVNSFTTFGDMMS